MRKVKMMKFRFLVPGMVTVAVAASGATHSACAEVTEPQAASSVAESSKTDNVFDFADTMGYVFKHREESEEMSEAIRWGVTSEEKAAKCRELKKSPIQPAIGGPLCPSQPYTQADVALAKYASTFAKGSPILALRIALAVLAALGGAVYAAGPQLAAWGVPVPWL
ncbi:hypothetical protein [Corynebacterium sp. NML130628]|uniref:hypothetical protein n=1 Tax=Corynebacterium sp. NML130628 TaxID=1906333 RepID=UPI000919EBC5|nr:hypothetical protein [Corynebacterium sp. NML130628]OIR44037.1 hypothetical protein BJP07_06065 [Corynebacterium sp. NML130628]